MDGWMDGIVRGKVLGWDGIFKGDGGGDGILG